MSSRRTPPWHLSASGVAAEFVLARPGSGAEDPASASSRVDQPLLDQVLSAGLSTEEAAARARMGEPFIAVPSDDDDDDDEPLWRKFLSQFQEPLILLLLASAAVSVLLSQWDDAASIVLAVVIVSTVAFIQEYKSEQSLAKLKEHAAQRCRLLRDGQVAEVRAEELVLGDVVHLAVGDKVPADIRLLHATDLRCDESLLTGESEPVLKTTDAVALEIGAAGIEVPIHERGNTVFQGTLVMSGRGAGVVVAVGRNTEMGGISTLLKSVDSVKTPLQIKMDELGKQLSILSFGVIAVIFLIGWLFGGHSMLEMFNVSVSLAVAAIPEGLPIVVTVTLAIGVQRMARRKAVVKRLPAVEALGAVDIVCADKTGTLTEGHMWVTRFSTSQDFAVGQDARNETVVSAHNEGTRDAGQGQPLAECAYDPHISALFRCAMLCNDAHPPDSRRGEVGAAKVLGNPTDVALLHLTTGAFGTDLRSQTSRVDEIPFNSTAKYSAVKVSIARDALAACVGTENVREVSAACPGGSSVELWFVKGAADILMPMCGESFFSPQRQSGLYVQEQADQYAREALRVIAFAVTPHDPRTLSSKSSGVCVFLGLVAVSDPLRAGVESSIRHCHGAGVKVVMITGDAKETAIAIASRLGIFAGTDLEDARSEGAVSVRMPTDVVGSIALSPVELESMSDSQLADSIDRVSVFYRMSPRHKLRIVRAFQARGHIVAMTGDGVNDAPALKAADVGVAMGDGGSDVAAEASELVLLDNDFSTIVHAMEEGRQIFANIQSFLRFQLTTSMAALTLLATHSIVARALGMTHGMPLNPMQILWINIIMDGPPAQSLGLEPQPSGFGPRHARSRDAPVITQFMIRQVIIGALVMVFGTFAVFFQYSPLQDEVSSAAGPSPPTEVKLDGHGSSFAGTAAFTTFVLFQMFNALNCRSPTASIRSLGVSSNQAFVWAVGGCTILQFVVVYFGPAQFIFETVALPLNDLLFVVGVASSVFVLDEVRKHLLK